MSKDDLGAPVLGPASIERAVPAPGRRRWMSCACLAAAAALTIAGCSSSSNSGGSTDNSTPAGASSGSGASSASAAAQLVPAQFKNGVTVATSAGYPPTDFIGPDGKITGFDYDLGQALGQKLGIPFNFKETTFASIIPGILAKKYDLVMDDMNDTKEREKQMTFVDYFAGGYALVVNKSDASKIHGLSDLCGTTVAVTQATAAATIAAQQNSECKKAGKAAVTINQLATGADDLLELRSGKAQVQVDDSNTAGYSVLQSKGAFVLVPLPQIPSGLAGIGMANSNAALAKAIQAGLQELIDDGTYKQLLAKYGLTVDAVDSATINGATS